MTASIEGGHEHYHLMEAPFRACGIAWGSHGIVRLQLPEATRKATEARLARGGRSQFLEPLPLCIEQAVAALRRYFAGDRVDFSDIEVDLGGVPAFHREIYAALRQIPWGETTTYGGLARMVGQPGAARAIGQAMGRNPVPVIIPCHRVLASGGTLGGFSAPGGAATKQRLLELERIASVERLPLFAPR
jgi:methylated-DNA-[protein]-cysteine S-methyltransferase